jgi:hypothetical protein
MTKYKQKYLMAQSRIDDYREGFERVLSERCPTDERHCGCVPILRAELAAKEKEKTRYQNALILITSLNGFYPEKTALEIQIFEIVEAALDGYTQYKIDPVKYWVDKVRDLESEIVNKKALAPND